LSYQLLVISLTDKLITSKRYELGYQFNTNFFSIKDSVM
jgi:hypothetical protein